MLGWLIRGIFLVSGFIASWFVARDALHFDIVQMVVGVLLFVFFVIIVAFWPVLKKWFRRR